MADVRKHIRFVVSFSSLVMNETTDGTGPRKRKRETPEDGAKRGVRFIEIVSDKDRYNIEHALAGAP
ncbi:hypothetical protein BaRGS_00031172 [Batillaria attramentaria]|uniref:Uncharacterized protein n=1 Tax=Batillaria attramentaria TaxID=370345 RepID=A0ABD0JRR1_9CAEN